MMYKNTLQAIGNTPLVRIAFDSQATIYAKLEYLNPSGSVKDRSAAFMIEQAEHAGQLQPGGTIIDASSGNHGVSVAMIGAMKGYKVIITVSEKISTEKLQAIKAYGATVIMCPATDTIEDPKSYHSVARRLHAQTPGSCMPDQYFNVANAHAHYFSLGPEIWKQTQGTITHFFAGAGTGGTLSGAGKYLKEQNSQIKVIAIDSVNSFRATGGNPKPYYIEGVGIDFISPVMNYDIVDDIITVTDADSFAMLKILAHKKGILAGPSSGAVARGVQQYLDNIPTDAVVVMIFGDSGRAYLTKNFYEKDAELILVQHKAPEHHQPTVLVQLHVRQNSVK